MARSGCLPVRSVDTRAAHAAAARAAATATNVVTAAAATCGGAAGGDLSLSSYFAGGSVVESKRTVSLVRATSQLLFPASLQCAGRCPSRL